MKEPSDHYYDLGLEEREMRRKAEEARKRKEIRLDFCEGGDTEPLHELSESDCTKEYAERVREFKRSLLTFVDSASRKHGIGANSEFFIVENPGEDVSHVAAAELGVRRMRRIRKRHPRTGKEYYGIPSAPDQPRPIDDFIHGAKVQMLAHEKGVRVPAVCGIILVEGAETIDRADEGVIEGTEETVTDAIVVMEKIDGLTFEQLCDPNLVLRNGEQAHKNGYQVRNFLREHGEDVRAHVAGLIRNGHGYLLDWDFDAILSGIREQVGRMHASDEEFPAILHNDLHAGNVIVRSDGTVFIIDFDLARVIDADSRVGEDLDDYRDIGKSVGDRNVYFLPDSYDAGALDDSSYAPMDALEQLALYVEAIRDAVAVYRENPEPSLDKI